MPQAIYRKHKWFVFLKLHHFSAGNYSNFRKSNLLIHAGFRDSEDKCALEYKMRLLLFSVLKRRLLGNMLLMSGATRGWPLVAGCECKQRSVFHKFSLLYTLKNIWWPFTGRMSNTRSAGHNLWRLPLGNVSW